jgi:hypothetical protein
VKPSGQDETWSSMAQTQVLRKAVLTKNRVIGSQLTPGLRQSGREETKEVKLSISIVLQAWMEFLRTTIRPGVSIEPGSLNSGECGGKSVVHVRAKERTAVSVAL